MDLKLNTDIEREVNFPSRAYIMKDKKCQPRRSKYLNRLANEQNVQGCLRGLRCELTCKKYCFLMKTIEKKSKRNFYNIAQQWVQVPGVI